MPKVRKRIKRTGVFRTPDELRDFFTALRIIIHSHCYENNPQYEVMIGSFLGILMTEYHEFLQLGITPIEFTNTEKDEVTRRNVLAIIQDIDDKIKLTEKLEGKDNGGE